ncbi:TIGR02281 family clan AA aspartic protease [Thiotrichales bacterium HSG1]|nr:TIGR02281 family clan AA aspartic protease [Thiotrichales bacterium HSG1]
MNKSPQQLGKGMIYIAWLFVLFLLYLFFNDALEKQHNPNQSITSKKNGVREVVLQRNRYGHYVANGDINGQPVVFLLDTGATRVSIPESVANNLNLQKGVPLQANTANGVITTYSVTLNKVAIGPVELSAVRASINPNMLGDEILLGMSFLKHLELIQRGNTLTLRQYSLDG